MKRNQMNKWFLATLVTMVGVAAPIASVDAAKSFTDVSAKHVYNKEISAMAELGIIHGYPDGTFKPNEKITRKHAAALISRAFETLPLDANYKSKTANDVTAGNTYKADIDKVVKAGVIVPDAKGNFRPNDLITRGEMAQALAKAYQLDKAGLTGKDATFIDKAKMNSFTAANLLYKAGITTGYDDNTFREKEGLSRAHYAVFMYRAANLAKAEAIKPADPESNIYFKHDPIYSEEVNALTKELASVKPPAGKSREQATADNVKEGNARSEGFVGSANVGEMLITQRAIQEEIENLTKYSGYTEIEAKALLKEVLNGGVYKGETPKGLAIHMYIKFDEKNINRLVSIIEKAGR